MKTGSVLPVPKLNHMARAYIPFCFCFFTWVYCRGTNAPENIFPLMLESSVTLHLIWQSQMWTQDALLGWLDHQKQVHLLPQQQVCLEGSILLSKPQLNHNSTQPNITLSWARPENDCAHHPTTHHPQKLNVSNISAATDPILMKILT